MRMGLTCTCRPAFTLIRLCPSERSLPKNTPESFVKKLVLLLLVLGATPRVAHGQDLFVLEVYRPTLEPKGTWEGEAYLNYIAQGPASTDQHAHASFELSHVLSRRLQVASYALFGRRPGLAPEFGGMRLRALI